MITRRRLLTVAAAAPVLTAAGTLPAFAAEPPVFARRGLAIRGYDPVAYFTDAAPVQGSADFATDYMGATWRFASAGNLETFLADPAAWAPQYGGYCAFAVASGYTAKTDPDAWTVWEDKLYLNFNRSVRARWLEDVPGYVAAGDANWPSVLG